MATTTKEKSNYHHGDLKSAMIKVASNMLNEQGIESLSLRKIAENVGVSRTAAYHHFRDKNDLLSAIASQGFVLWQEKFEEIFNNNNQNKKAQLQQFFHAYIEFATQYPNTYNLMFGDTLWKDNNSSPELKTVAYPSFEHQVAMTAYWQKHGILPSQENTLRLAQVIWGTLHGIAKLLLDGIYTDNTNVIAMCDCAINLFTSAK